LVVSLTHWQREAFKLIGEFQSAAQATVAEGARAFGSAGATKQRFIATLQLLSTEEGLPYDGQSRHA
jgi:hypothetical protein